MSIRHYLNFNMTRLLNIFFNKYSSITEAGARLISGTFKSISAFFLIPGHTHTFTATSSGSFKHYWVTNLSADLHGMACIANHISVTRDTVHTRFTCDQF